MIKTRLINLLAHAKKYIVLVILFQWINLLAQVVMIFTLSNLIENLYYQTLTNEIIELACIKFLFVIVIKFICDKAINKASFLASVDVKRILREKIYEKMLTLGSSYSEKVATSEIVQVSSEGVEQLETYFGKYLPQLFYSLIAPITLFIILKRISFKASIVLLICVPLIPISIVVVQKIAKRLLNKYWGIYTSLGDSFLENLQGLTTLKVYQADEKKAEEMDEESEKFRNITMKVLTMQLNSTSVMDIVAYGGAAIGMAVAILEFAKGNISISGILCILLLASEFFLPLRLLGSYFHIAMNGMAASDKIFKILDIEECEEKQGKIKDEPLGIEFNDVHFAYEKDREILKGISLKIPAKSFVSIVGESGCGKSTIASIISGRNKKYEGEILIGSMPLNKIAEEDLLKHILLVKHNSYLFKGSVKDNLLMAKENASVEEMIRVLEKVNLWRFLENQDGLDTKLLEKASNLSGGQAQRLVLAKALLKDNVSIYIFDEATSNIDVESEEIIMKVIHELAKEKTVLLISHRLANVVSSDAIFYLKDGMIKEIGKHDDLIKLNGEYAHIYNSQIALENYAKEVA